MGIQWINLPPVADVDPTKVVNANYEYLQGGLQTLDATSALIYQDHLVDKGVYLYEARIVGVETGSNFASFKRTFTVFKDVTGSKVLDISSDYTKKEDPNWAVNILAEEDDILLYVKGDAFQTVTWVITLVKTMYKV